jgi:hypothetical protein
MVAPGNVAVVMATVASMVTEIVAVDWFPTESVAVTTTLETTLAEVELVGVPVIAPVVDPILRPAGSVDPPAAAQLQVKPVFVPPDAVKVVPG